MGLIVHRSIDLIVSFGDVLAFLKGCREIAASNDSMEVRMRRRPSASAENLTNNVG